MLGSRRSEASQIDQRHSCHLGKFKQNGTKLASRSARGIGEDGWVLLHQLPCGRSLPTSSANTSSFISCYYYSANAIICHMNPIYGYGL